MRRVNAVAATAAVVLAALSHPSSPASAQVVAYEGARLIVGDGRVVENATLVVDGARIVQAGAGVAVPAGATRVNLAGKTVMPAIIDTHVHLSATRERLIRDLKLRGYWGVERRHEHGHRQSRTAADAQRGHSRRRALPQRRARHHPQGADAPDAPDRDRGRRPQGGPGERRAQASRSSRSGSTTATARSRRSRPRNMPPSSTRRTRPACASPRISSTWTTRRG